MKYLYAFALLIVTNIQTYAQEETDLKPTNFWKDVRFGGGLGIGFGNNNTSISIAPMAFKPLSENFMVGVGLQYNYFGSRDVFKTSAIGGSVMALYNPIQEVQLSVEVEELYVNSTTFGYYDGYNTYADINEKYWNTALFLGAGYNMNGVTIGIRYNVLYNDNNAIYTSALLPFVRVMF